VLSHVPDPGCSRRVKRFGNICNSCDTGHEMQVALSKTRIRPYQLMAARYLDMHGSEAWNAMRTAWRKFVDGVRDDLAAQDRRGVVRTHERTAWQQIVTVDQTADEDMIILTLLAMGIMFEQEPTAFKDQPSFMAQTARRFRALSQDLKKSYRYSTKDSAKVLTDISRMAVLSMGKRLLQGYAVYGVSHRTRVGREGRAGG